MNYGLYAAFLGMRARQRTLDVMANNLANASTAGFKAEGLLYRSVESAEIEAQRASEANKQASTTGPTTGQSEQTNFAPTDPQTDIRAEAKKQSRAVGVLTNSMTDYSPGPIRETGRALDVALDGDAFLVVQTPRGERYTRAGNFTLDANGQLVTHKGDLVVGGAGPITVPSGEVTIGEDGTISVQGQTIDQLKLVRFNDPRSALLKEGETLYMATGKENATETFNVRVVQGSLEMANVNTVSEMAAMIQNSREFDSLQRNITLLMNDLGRKVSSEIGKI
jgi:flagellar basal-body rod protein FlgF